MLRDSPAGSVQPSCWPSESQEELAQVFLPKKYTDVVTEIILRKLIHMMCPCISSTEASARQQRLPVSDRDAMHIRFHFITGRPFRYETGRQGIRWLKHSETQRVLHSSIGHPYGRVSTSRPPAFRRGTTSNVMFCGFLLHPYRCISHLYCGNASFTLDWRKVSHMPLIHNKI